MIKQQGPMCALQSVAGTKHREAADLWFPSKLTDALENLLQNFYIHGQPFGYWKQRTIYKGKELITSKYPNFYKGGYLELSEITDENNMEIFASYLENNLKDIKFLSQWVKCEGTEKTQLQVFTAASSFQRKPKSIWDRNDKLTELMKKCCVMLIEAQYKALAQAAAVRSIETGKNVKLHVTMIGHGVFNNPEETVEAALKALKTELKGYDVTVFLHYYGNNPWNKGIEKTDVKCISLADWKKGIKNES